MKTDIKRLDSTTHNDSAATKTINDNFAALQAGIEDSLSRSGKAPNFMDKELDMNSRRIINVGAPVDETDAVSYKVYKEHIDTAVQARVNAAISASQAEASKQRALYYSQQAKNYRDSAEKIVVEGTEQLNTIIDDGVTNITNTIDDGQKDLKSTIDEGVMDVSDLTEKAKDALQEFAELPAKYYTKPEVDEKIKDCESYTREVEVGHSTGPWEAETTQFPYWYEFAVQVSGRKYSNIIVSFEESAAMSGDWSPICKMDDTVSEDGWTHVTLYCKKPDQYVKATLTFIR